MYKIILLLFFIMLFCHITDDFYLQGILADLKQRRWWRENAPFDLYENDYIIALLLHGYSWSFMIHLPLICYYFLGSTHIFLPEIFKSIIINTIAHAIIDNEKANEYSINLIQDQLIHIIQIIATLIILWYI